MTQRLCDDCVVSFIVWIVLGMWVVRSKMIVWFGRPLLVCSMEMGGAFVAYCWGRIVLGFSLVRLWCIFELAKVFRWQSLMRWLEKASHMMCFILCESFPRLLNSCEWDGEDVCNVVKYVCVVSLDSDSGLRYMNVFIRVAFFDVLKLSVGLL